MSVDLPSPIDWHHRFVQFANVRLGMHYPDTDEGHALAASWSALVIASFPSPTRATGPITVGDD